MYNHIINKKEKKKLIESDFDAYFWNAIAGGISSFQSIIVIFFISWNIGTNAAGVFSIGYAIAVLLTSIIKYGIRTYQVTDIEGKYDTGDYFVARAYTSSLVIIILLAYSYFMTKTGHYGRDKSLTIIYIFLWKSIEGVEDVLIGYLQQNDKLGFGARLQTYRLALSTVVYVFTISYFGDLKTASVITAVISVLLTGQMIRYIIIKNSIELDGKKTRALQLLAECTPLCIVSAIVILIGNLPKYLVDLFLNDDLQGIFGYIMSPSYVIVLFSMLVYQPEIKKYGELWTARDYEEFADKIRKQILLIVAFLIVVLIVCFAVGIPVLSFVYGTDLCLVKEEFMMLMLGGGIYAIANFLMIPVVAMREQNIVSIFYFIITIICSFAGQRVVSRFQIWGAASMYIIINILCCTVLLALIFTMVNKAQKERFS